MKRSKTKEKFWIGSDEMWGWYVKAYPEKAALIADKANASWTPKELSIFVEGFSIGVLAWANRPEVIE